MTIIEVMITPQWQLNFVPSFAFPSILRVKHHNILQLVDAFETKKEYFIFLELWVLLEAVARKGWHIASARRLLFACRLDADVSSAQSYRQRGLRLDPGPRVLLWEGH